MGTYGYVKCGGEGGSIVACVVGEQQEPTFCCVLDSEGSVIKHLTLHFLKCNISKGTGKGRDPTQRGLVQRKHLDTRQFKNFIRTHTPSMIVIEASNIQCEYFT